MPFLRRRGVMASESDMRRHSLFDAVPLPKPPPPPQSGSTSDLPTLTSVAEDPSSFSAAPPSPPELPRDSISVVSTHGGVPAIVEPSEGRPSDGAESQAVSDYSHKQRRFSMLRFRNASDSHLAAKAKLHAAAQKPPPVPRPAVAPEIITTAPTFNEQLVPRKKTSRISFAARLRRSGELPRPPDIDGINGTNGRSAGHQYTPRIPEHSVSFDETHRPSSSHTNLAQASGDERPPGLALPPNRLSESSRSDASSGERGSGATIHSIYATTSFFRLARRKTRQPEPLFPIAHLQKSKSASADNSAMSSSSFLHSTAGSHDHSASNGSRAGQVTPTQSRAPSRNGMTTPPPPNGAVAAFARSAATPATALFRPSSRQSGQSSPTRSYAHRRGRSSTMSSLGRNSPRESEDHLAPPTSRTSISTGRKSFSDLLGLGKLGRTSDMVSRQGTLTPMTGGSTSKNNSLQLPREPATLPERREDESPSKYLERVLESVSRSVVAAILSKNTDAFSQAVLRSYMRGFKFFGDPMDMALRKLLMEAELPKETQQIDRFLQAFANRYHECNPGIYSTPDQAYFIAFSLLILHTDVFNKNNKHKMQKADYLKNTHGEGIFDEILEVFYDNITYTPFIHVEDDSEANGDRAQKARKKSIFPHHHPDPAKKVAKEPVDPYTLIIDDKLELLRPNLRDVMQLDDPYNYLGTAKSLNMKELQRTFFKTGVLQIVSPRSRPDAFMSEKTATNPEEAHPGIVDIKVTKVGLLWRKDAKKKKTRSPWQEWGAILTGAQLYFFRNTAWVKQLMHQQKEHLKKGHGGDPCIFNPPLPEFKPDALISTDGAVALVDASYTKHKHAFVYVRHGSLEEVLLAEDEDEMNDWLAKLNYAAAFRTSGVRMRGVIGGNLDGQNRRAIRGSSSGDVEVIQTPSGEVTVTRSRIDHKMAQDILTARRAFMRQKIAEAEEKLKEAEATLESQLRNSRHLQLQAPILPKTREQMLLSAARMAAQLKWTRMEIWRLRCHRDILQMDLDEEAKALGLPPDEKVDATKKSPAKDDGRSSLLSVHPMTSPPALAQLSLTDTATITQRPGGDSSPVTEAFQTPPTTATVIREDSWSAAPLDSHEPGKASTSAAGGSEASLPIAPGDEAGPSSSPGKQPFEEPDDDADERELLEQAGLLQPEISRTSEHKSAIGAVEAEETHEQRERRSSVTRGDKSKIRRSLQRTLREGAGHISHHRHRRAKDSTSTATLPDDASSDILPRGSGQFVVHGKKASVITFGNELQQSLSSEDRIRQRLQRENSVSSHVGPSEGGSDFQSILTSISVSDREHRGSGASASTATARSFRELHRRYSNAQAMKSGSGSGHLALPSDEDSDAAVSFSEGRRTPLPPIDAHEEQDQEEHLHSRSADADGEEYIDLSPTTSREGRNTVYFTPEPPASPVVESSKEAEAEAEQEQRNTVAEGGDRLPSPPLQSVSA
ncbi:hypothetical protein VTJ49DRAFT_5118 [Mycothermus thermophilus]|uniref:Protein transport protein sec73 n=1 Tax=Humicola insolens TaxID=85995 RepID=A0ABR3VLD4_HUMIN